jgi:hypothetical protein
MSLLADAAFWVSISTLVIGAYRFSISQAYKSKCSKVNMCFGLLDIQRNVEIEHQIDERAMELEQGEHKEDA